MHWWVIQLSPAMEKLNEPDALLIFKYGHCHSPFDLKIQFYWIAMHFQCMCIYWLRNATECNVVVGIFLYQQIQINESNNSLLIFHFFFVRSITKKPTFDAMTFNLKGYLSCVLATLINFIEHCFDTMYFVLNAVYIVSTREIGSLSAIFSNYNRSIRIAWFVLFCCEEKRWYKLNRHCRWGIQSLFLPNQHSCCHASCITTCA